MNLPIRQSSWCQHVRYGMGAAEVVKCEPSMEAREAGVADVMARTGATLVPPYNHGPVIEGQGTLALELFDQVFPRSLHRYFAANSALAAVFAVSFDDDDSGDSQTAAAAAVPTVSDSSYLLPRLTATCQELSIAPFNECSVRDSFWPALKLASMITIT